MMGAVIWILSDRLNTPKSVLYAISGGVMASFTIGGLGLYLDWFRWTVPEIIDLKGSYVMLEQGITGLMKATFPTWIAMLFLCLYPFWFALGYEFAKGRRLGANVVPILVIGVLLLLIPSVIESQFLAH